MTEKNHELFPIKLKEYAGRIEYLEEEKAGVLQQIKEVYQEAESKGFDKKALKQALKMLKLRKKEREEQIELTLRYLEEIGG